MKKLMDILAVRAGQSVVALVDEGFITVMADGQPVDFDTCRCSTGGAAVEVPVLHRDNLSFTVLARDGQRVKLQVSMPAKK